jgi:hypothetical protein
MHGHTNVKNSSMCEFCLTSQIPRKTHVITSILHNALNLNRILQYFNLNLRTAPVSNVF